ncbi:MULTISPECIES: pseudouridine-5'-phosphate glycosidase [Anaerotruncus]|uniref:Pseudouridine-5'-phosphate glycosidase n=2 Tax=Anaerotruncus TaxID=244127 RepID=A0A498CQN8_9FIRM|nr:MULTISPECIES: pseudouridine-5'-phosphate glycosidase [Anaerotruncus]MBC3938952.1 pseudouridine-5'-phosphate glycosidase [Anaerotruncus massiliensis (ex Togo et al. 2019)]MCQ4896441.1 pseudouridine-5'-phosphate glycosidase [Anaerotruncus sp. DFI.9.16]RLL10653.1 pseudouridine-5'-phosphate glycosidase [Anaerotruncus massiliensis (ex Liu et al. 2021)]GKH47947.1 pseudouridine-5'-phosphate glycosidase [Oscillospiraceae bacterium]
MNRLEKYLEVSPRIREALDNNRPVVTLESTIISHGMPYPRNVETALKVEEVVRSCGAEPATVAVIGGKLKVGISEEEITHLGKKGLGVIKASRRDLPVLCARGEDGATTVAATMILSALAGVQVFATGGVGGVHRGAETTMDISADLEELAETPVMVVCAGAKSILDLGLTLEYLETKGVTVLGYQTEELPAFYTRKSGFKVDYRMDTPEEIAAAFSAKEDLGLRGGMLVTNPIPEQYAMDHDYISRTIEDACAEAAQKGVKGKELTPFLLDRIQQITAGKSLEANIELVYNNARLASRIAVELCKK